jgi:3-deoxy-D-manno-octulosonate 8-phosphate phosphatase (KDO 8-P phosphatase)
MSIDFKRLKLIISEIDGIVTEHLTAFDPMGISIFKQYNLKDFEAVNELKKIFTFVFISSDNSINYKVCRDKNIPFYYAQKSKLSEISNILKRYNVTPDEVLYVGSTYSDLDCINLIPLSACPSDSVAEVRNAALIKLENPSGLGVLCELYSLLRNEINIRKRLDF